MNNSFTSLGLSARIWLLTTVWLTVGFILSGFWTGFAFGFYFLLFFAGSLIVSIPAFVALLIAFPVIRQIFDARQVRCRILILLLFLIALGYAGIVDMLEIPVFGNSPGNFLWITLSLFGASFIATISSVKGIASFFAEETDTALEFSSVTFLFNANSINKKMEHPSMQVPAPAQSNRLLIKGLITGGLILLMYIPTVFIQNLVKEREQRQKEVVAEVSSKWASAQTVSGPFLVIPYNFTIVGTDGKPVAAQTQYIITADQLTVNGEIKPEERPRSIYKVLLYRTALNFSGNFKPEWPGDINAANMDLAHAKLCFSLSDFKGIEEELSVNFNGQKLLLNPGLPVNDLGETGLSVPVDVSQSLTSTGIKFDMQVKLKGSEQLNFLPLSSNSKFNISSSWPDPSFDGNNLPTQRTVKENGFTAQWNFNRANLSFGSVTPSGKMKASGMAFGVSMVQPADQYNKTMRSVKYSILIIGLSFALFFIIEIMQKKPLHPVQYILVGLALVIFYSLLLSISEFISFDIAYLVAASATVLLISFYTKAHFKNWRSATVMGIALSILYLFVFILIRLEDTALLAGSIGLFVILAVVMFVSRKINWYGVKEETISLTNPAI